MDPKQSVEIITEMINNTRENVKDSSVFFIFWGWLVFISAGGHYTLMVFTDYEMPWIFWPILMPLGGVVSGIIGSRMEKKQGYSTHYDRALVYVWGGFIMLMVFLLIFMVHHGYMKTYPIIMACYAMGSFVTGGIIKFRALIMGATVGFMLAVVALFATFEHQLLLMAASIVATYLVPGYLLKSSGRV